MSLKPPSVQAAGLYQEQAALESSFRMTQLLFGKIPVPKAKQSIRDPARPPPSVADVSVWPCRAC